jgi:hypothetical protein
MYGREFENGFWFGDQGVWYKKCGRKADATARQCRICSAHYRGTR